MGCRRTSASLILAVLKTNSMAHRAGWPQKSSHRENMQLRDTMGLYDQQVKRAYSRELATLLAQRIHLTSHLYSYVRSIPSSEWDGQGTFLQCTDRYTIWTSGSCSYWDEQNIFKGHKISDAKWTKRICKDSSVFECRCDIHQIYFYVFRLDESV